MHFGAREFGTSGHERVEKSSGRDFLVGSIGTERDGPGRADGLSRLCSSGFRQGCADGCSNPTAALEKMEDVMMDVQCLLLDEVLDSTHAIMEMLHHVRTTRRRFQLRTQRLQSVGATRNRQFSKWWTSVADLQSVRKWYMKSTPLSCAIPEIILLCKFGRYMEAVPDGFRCTRGSNHAVIWAEKTASILQSTKTFSDADNDTSPLMGPALENLLRNPNVSDAVFWAHAIREINDRESSATFDSTEDGLMTNEIDFGIDLRPASTVPVVSNKREIARLTVA